MSYEVVVATYWVRISIVVLEFSDSVITFEVILSKAAFVEHYLGWDTHKDEDDSENHRKETRVESIRNGLFDVLVCLERPNVHR